MVEKNEWRENYQARGPGKKKEGSDGQRTDSTLMGKEEEETPLQPRLSRKDTSFDR